MAINKPAKTPSNKSQIAQQSGLAVQQASFSGPIPPPGILQGYESILPGAAERILAMAEAEGKHMREIEMAALYATKQEVRLGQCFGFLIALVALATTLISLHLGSELVASIVGGTTVVGLVSAFIFGRVKKVR